MTCSCQGQQLGCALLHSSKRRRVDMKEHARANHRHHWLCTWMISFAGMVTRYDEHQNSLCILCPCFKSIRPQLAASWPTTRVDSKPTVHLPTARFVLSEEVVVHRRELEAGLMAGSAGVGALWGQNNRCKLDRLRITCQQQNDAISDTGHDPYHAF
jgi:hypothetical protein